MSAVVGFSGFSMDLRRGTTATPLHVAFIAAAAGELAARATIDVVLGVHRLMAWGKICEPKSTLKTIADEKVVFVQGLAGVLGNRATEFAGCEELAGI